MPRHLVGPVITTAGAVAILVGSFLPWLRSGRRGRSSYELYGLAERLDFAGGTLARGLVALWPLVPLVVVAAALAAWSSRRYVSTGLAILAACYVVVVCIVAWRAPLPAMVGVAVTFVGAVALLAAPLALVRPAGR